MIKDLCELAALISAGKEIEGAVESCGAYLRIESTSFENDQVEGPCLWYHHESSPRNGYRLQLELRNRVSVTGSDASNRGDRWLFFGLNCPYDDGSGEGYPWLTVNVHVSEGEDSVSFYLDRDGYKPSRELLEAFAAYPNGDTGKDGALAVVVAMVRFYLAQQS